AGDFPALSCTRGRRAASVSFSRPAAVRSRAHVSLVAVRERGGHRRSLGLAGDVDPGRLLLVRRGGRGFLAQSCPAADADVRFAWRPEKRPSRLPRTPAPSAPAPAEQPGPPRSRDSPDAMNGRTE